MIADYLVDYNYLADRLGECSSDSRFFMGLKMLCDVVDFDNARFVADESLLCLGPIRELALRLNKLDFEERRKLRIAEWFCKSADNVHRFRKVKAIVREGDLVEIDPAPMYVISDDNHPGSSWQVNGIRRFTIEEYFSEWENEKRRLRLSKRRTFGVGFAEPGEFAETVRRFACSDRYFRIFDRYAISLGDGNGLERACRNILEWIRMLSNELSNECHFVIQANCSSQDSPTQMRNRLSDALSAAAQRVYGDNDNHGQTIEFRLVPGDGRTMSMSILHDRFICSNSRVMSIGKGLDALAGRGTPECINLQYCGRYRSDALMAALDRMGYDVLEEIRI